MSKLPGNNLSLLASGELTVILMTAGVSCAHAEDVPDSYSLEAPAKITNLLRVEQLISVCRTIVCAAASRYSGSIEKASTRVQTES